MNNQVFPVEEGLAIALVWAAASIVTSAMTAIGAFCLELLPAYAA